MFQELGAPTVKLNRKSENNKKLVPTVKSRKSGSEKNKNLAPTVKREKVKTTKS